MRETKPLKVHITGVYGLIGNLVYSHLASRGDSYELYGSGRRTMSSVRADAEQISQLPEGHFVIADVSDAGAISAAMEGMDVVLHIAAVPDPSASFEDVLSSNIVGTRNVLEACRQAGVKRLVYASSIMTNWGYLQHAEPYRSIGKGEFTGDPADIPIISHTDPTWPTEAYSASKVWAEGYCRTYVDSHGMSIVCLRIGWVNKENTCHLPHLGSVWCSNGDIVQAFERALIATEEPRYDICYAISASQYRWTDMEHTRQRIGFVPQDRAESSI